MSVSDPIYGSGQVTWPNETQDLFGFSEPASGCESVFAAGSEGYLHSPLFGRMPVVSDSVPNVMDGFDLGSSAYFF